MRFAVRCAGPLLVVAVAAWTASAQAGLWQQDLEQTKYQEHIATADRRLEIAMKMPASQPEITRQYLSALAAYREAIAVLPFAPQAHWKLGNAILIRTSDCRRTKPQWCSDNARSPAEISEPSLSREGANALLRFVELAPEDPRVGDALRLACIAFTKLAAKADLVKAKRCYERLLEGKDVSAAQISALNLAEVNMMLGELEPAIALYEDVLPFRGEASDVLGLAVALDRNGRGEEARSLIRAIGPESLAKYERDVREGDTFYVPNGEVFYYLALLSDAKGDLMIALSHYDSFIASGAHPQFQARAKANRDQILRRLRKRQP